MPRACNNVRFAIYRGVLLTSAEIGRAEARGSLPPLHRRSRMHSLTASSPLEMSVTSFSLRLHLTSSLSFFRSFVLSFSS